MESVTIACGPTTATFTEFDASTFTEAYACGKQQERYTSGTVRSVKLRSAYIILLIVIFLQVVSCNSSEHINEVGNLITNTM